MKRSVQAAMEEARQHSLRFPEVTVRVMDKPKKFAITTASEWVYRERVLEGWHTVAAFVNGQEVKA